jgi:predicted nucleotidyltransferase
MNTEDRRRLAVLLAGSPFIRIALLFGSLAKGRATPESDLDLAVGAGRRLSVEERMALIAALASAFGRPVDLVDLATVGEPLLGQILQGGVRVLGSSSDYAELVKRHLFDLADFVPYQKRILRERRQAWIGT